ncbi:hypothetical protein BDFB_014898 [Asbolus verrucosus]|uniref:Uncharacterized protein n=1 Tax=Asbolus verrucosus TaxID=1661398 RepID=A0A482V789_ASBVE|nr:hypothetical protein BDFB_014898 [Asbolus verrucosus]
MAREDFVPRELLHWKR